MAEYKDVIKQFKRMCRYYTGDKEGCPLYCKGHGCNISHCRMLAFDDNKFANIVVAWAAEHPEPKYPTWGEWLTEMGVLLNIQTSRDPTPVYIAGIGYGASIPADVAQKLGIEPKEET